MKKILILLIITSGISISAQVGVNNPNPVRMLDINGNLRLRGLEYKKNDPNYTKILVTNAAGEIEYWDKQDILDKIDQLYVVNKKFVLSATGPDTNLIVPCGRFQFRYNNPVMPQIKLVTANTSDTNIYYSRIRKRNSSANNFTVNTGRSLNTNQMTTINASNQWVDIGNATDSTGAFSKDTLDEYYITYPGDVNMYRVTFVARTAADNNVSYSMVCERF
ncbi:hypothetical protein [Chryseobacterium sp. T1]